MKRPIWIVCGGLFVSGCANAVPFQSYYGPSQKSPLIASANTAFCEAEGCRVRREEHGEQKGHRLVVYCLDERKIVDVSDAPHLPSHTVTSLYDPGCRHLTPIEYRCGQCAILQKEEVWIMPGAPPFFFRDHERYFYPNFSWRRVRKVERERSP